MLAHGKARGARTMSSSPTMDVDGRQLRALQASLDVYFNPSERCKLCATADGRHPCGLILLRPARPGCSPSRCLCRADTVTMAFRLGFGAAGGLKTSAHVRPSSSRPRRSARRPRLPRQHVRLSRSLQPPHALVRARSSTPHPERHAVLRRRRRPLLSGTAQWLSSLESLSS